MNSTLLKSEMIAFYLLKQLSVLYNQFINLFNVELFFQNEIVEHNDSYTIFIKLPILKKEDIVIEMFDKDITVCIKLNQSDSALYKLNFHLDKPIVYQEIFANYFNNILEIYLPKMVEPSLISLDNLEINLNEYNYNTDYNEEY